MYYLNKFCILCTSNLKLKLLYGSDMKRQTSFYIKILLPELEYFKYEHPVYICANCENIVNAYNNLKKICLENYKKWKQYVGTLKENCNAERGEVQIRIYKSDESADAEEYNDNNLYIDNCDSDISIINISSYVDNYYDVESPKNIVVESPKNIVDTDITTEEVSSSSIKESAIEENTDTKKEISCHCGKHFCSKEALKKHEILHTGKFKCSLCKCGYTRLFRLKHHYSRKHPQVKNPYYSLWKYECPSCTMKYTCFYLYDDHIKHTCNLTNNSNVNKRLYFKNCKCIICHQKFSSKVNLLSHMVTHEELKYTCSQCKMTFITESELKFHLKKMHNFGIYECQQCNKRYLTKAGLRSHKINQSCKLECKDCNIIFTRINEFHEHKCFHQERILCSRCPFCDEIYTCKNNLYDHIQSHHQSESQQNTDDGILQEPVDEIQNVELL